MIINNEISPATSDVNRKERAGFYCTPVDNSTAGIFVMEEIWKDVINFKGSYQISNHGSLKSLKRHRACANARFKNRVYKELIMKPSITSGYYGIMLSKNSERTNKLLHRIVAEAFIPNPENKPCINHKDTDKLNNHVDNLEWCTYKENFDHAVLNNLINCSGENNCNSRLTIPEVVKIKELLSKGVIHKDIAKQFNVERSTITSINRKRTWVA